MSGLHRVVFDTSTLVSAALRVGSVPHQALMHAVSTGEVCVSQATLGELEQVLLRPKFDKYQSQKLRLAFLGLIRELAVLLPVSEKEMMQVVPPCRDPKDHPFLALVLASEADVLVSSDADLLVMHPWRGVPILAPGDYLQASA